MVGPASLGKKGLVCVITRLAYRAALGAELQADLDHINGLNDACCAHTGQTCR